MIEHSSDAFPRQTCCIEWTDILPNLRTYILVVKLRTNSFDYVDINLLKSTV